MDTVSYYCLDRNRKKAVISLKGILQGIAADQQLNEVEVLFLDVWLKSQEHLRDDPDAIDLIDAVDDILADGIVTEEEIEDLKCLVNDIVEFKDFPRQKDIDRVNEFLGVLSGVVADDVLNYDEMSALIEWLNANDDLFDSFPINLVVKQFDQLKNSVTEQSGPDDLLNFLKQVSGAKFSETGSADIHPLSFIEDTLEAMTHQDSAICVSGEFDLGDRDDVIETAMTRGYVVKTSISKKVDYLIFGSKVSPNWGSSNFGGKIEKAVKLRLEGHPIKIVSENQWLDFL
ncbi:BRCT domain-containing protein [Marinomonas posidonica]|uniref:BRCT domain-containing protein n=1 Tax=Marinomonas posidonica TaxID=936476 RepID=UPI0037364EF0